MGMLILIVIPFSSSYLRGAILGSKKFTLDISGLYPHCLVQKWNEIIGQARQSVDFLKDQDVIRAVLNILQVLLI